MATGRILKKQISLSEAVNDLSLKAALLFTWAIPHADDFGRMPGSPRRVKAAVVPMREDFSLDDVAMCIQELHEAGLVCWYTVDGEQHLSFPTWESHQAGLHKRTRSRLPPPPGIAGKAPERAPEAPGNSGKLPPNGTEQNGTEGNGTDEPPNAPPPAEERTREPDPEAEQIWRAVVDLVESKTTPGAVEIFRRCRCTGLDDSTLTVDQSMLDPAAKGRLKAHVMMLMAALREVTGRQLQVRCVESDHYDARAGPT